MPDTLTQDQIYNLDPPESGQEFYWFGRGLALRITASGAKSFVLQYRFDDPSDSGRKSSSYRFTIGEARAQPRGQGWTLGEALKEADKWRKLIDRGETHPLAQRRGRQQSVKATREAETFKDAFEEYIEHEAKGRKENATADDVKRAVLKHCKAWEAWPVAGIDAGEIGKLLRKVRDGSKEKKTEPRPYMANRLFAYLNAFFRWCAKPDVKKVPASPMAGMTRPWDGEEVRDRVFTDAEIKAIWKAADAIGGVAGAYVKTVLLTGKRKSAIAKMKWAEIEDDWTWVPPVDRRRKKKTKRLHGVPLPRLAQRVLAPLRPSRDDASKFVFPGRTSGSHLYPGDDLAGKVRENSGVDDFFWHALRHTLETRAAEFGIEPHIRDLVLDHAPARGAGEGYDHWHYKPQMLAALETWADHVEAVVSPKGAKVLR